jgi:hypothetical protein
MSVEAMKQALEALEKFRYHLANNYEINAAITSLRQAIAVYESAPPECQTEAEKTAFAFGWWKAMEAQRANKHSATHRKHLTITNEMAFAFHRVLSDGSISKDETEEIKRGLESAFAHMITHQYVPMQKEGETFSVEYYEIDTQPKCEWVGLTQEELLNLDAGIVNFEYAAAIEAKLKEKNT